MANKTELMLRAKARRRRAEAESTGTLIPAAAPAAARAPSDPALALPRTAPGVQYHEPSLIENIMGGAGNVASTVGGVAKQGLHGIATGVEQTIGLPGDIADAIGISPGMPLFGQLPSSQDIYNISRLGGLLPERSEPQGPVESITRRVGEEIGATLMPMEGVVASAVARGVPAIRAAQKTAGPISGWLEKHIFEPAAVDPANFLQKETAGASAAGTGAGVANLAVDRDTTAGQWADMGGQAVGVGVASAGNAVISRLGDLFSALSGNPRLASKVVRQNVADTLISNSDELGSQVDPAHPYEPIDTDRIIDMLSIRAPAENIIPGFQASSADRAGDFGLASLENARSKGPNAGRFRARQDENTEAIDQTLAALAPTEQPGAFTTALATECDAQLLEAIQGSAAARTEADQLVAPLIPASTPAARGNTVRTGLEDARDVARAATEDAYAAADVNDVPVDPTDLAATIDNATAGLTEVERGLVPEGVLARVRALGEPEAPVDTGVLDASGNPIMREPEAPDPVRMKEATDLLSELKRLQRAAIADPRAERGGRNAARVLGRIIDAVDGFITANVSPEDADALAVARATKFDEAEAFTRTGDPVAGALARHEGGQPKMRDERVAGTFVNTQNMDRLLAQADTPQIRTAIREELLSRGGFTTADQIDDFMASHGEQVDRFPGLRQDLERASMARRRQAAAEGNATELDRTLVTGKGPIATYLRYDPEQSERAMTNVINADKPGEAADELLSFVQDEPRAVEGAKRAFWNVMERVGRSKNAAFETASGVEPWMPKKWRSFLEQPNVAAVMDRLYRDNQEHLERIRQIAEALRGVNTGNKAGAAINPSGSAQQLRNGPITLAEAQAKFIDVQRGRLNPLYAVTYLAGKIANRLVSKQAERSYQMLLDEALMNPEVAAELLRANNPANRAALARKAKLWLGNEVSGLAELFDENESADQAAPAGEPDKRAGDDEALYDAIFR